MPVTRSRPRLLFAFWDGGRGHLTRTLALAAQARRRGAVVGIVTSSKFAAELRAAGSADALFVIENRPPRQGLPPYPMPLYSHAYRHAQRLRGLGFHDAEWIMQITRQEMDTIRSFRPSVIVNDYRDTIRSAAEACGVPVLGITHATGNRGGAIMGSWVDVPPGTVMPDCRDSFNSVRVRLGLAPIEDERFMFEGDMSIVPSTPALDPLDADCANTVYAGLITGAGSGAHVPVRLSERGTRFNVYSYVGEPTRPQFGFEAVLDQVVGDLPDVGFYIVSDENRFAAGGPVDRRRRAGTVVVERYIPGAAAMADSAVTICHGGNSTVMLALTLGRPVICVGPYHSDCAAAFRRVAAEGAGFHLPHSVGPLERRPAPDLGTDVEIFGYWHSEITSNTLRDAITTVADDDRFAVQARRMGADLLALGGTDTVLDICVEF
ncbi:hypothetical protein AB0B66_34995 [Catellatospora sp. NPDC049111]|uniref:hypothetical protein n=1 Tax=Catellatospora sp. NPDC049111 TaxID=3155271 RepID=UPI0033F603FB